MIVDGQICSSRELTVAVGGQINSSRELKQLEPGC